METIYVTRSGQAQEEYRGLHHTFPSPYHLYLRTEDLAGSSSVRFIVYSLGRTKVIMAGIYRLTDQSFHVTYSCDYKSLSRLNDYLTTVRADYISALTIVKDRATKKLKQLIGIHQPHQYEQLKLWLSFQPLSKFYTTHAVSDRLQRLKPETDQQLANEDPFPLIRQLTKQLEDSDLLGDTETAFKLYEQIEDLKVTKIRQLDREVTKLEEKLNMITHHSADKLVASISIQFYQWISSSIYGSANWAHQLPTCDDYSYIHLFGEDLT